MQTMRPDLLEVDWSNIQTAIDAMRLVPSQTNKSNLLQIRLESSQVQELLDDGWPVQEIVIDHADCPQGIPAELARIVINVFEFCSEHNIDLVKAIQMNMTARRVH